MKVGPRKSTQKGSDYFSLFYHIQHSLIASMSITMPQWNNHIFKLCHKIPSDPSYLIEHSTTVLVVPTSYHDANGTPSGDFWY